MQIINSALREELFRDHLDQFRDDFRKLTGELENKLCNVIEEQRSALKSTLDIVRDEYSTVSENRWSPESRNRVGKAAEDSQAHLNRIHASIQ